MSINDIKIQNMISMSDLSEILWYHLLIHILKVSFADLTRCFGRLDRLKWRKRAEK